MSDEHTEFVRNFRNTIIYTGVFLFGVGVMVIDHYLDLHLIGMVVDGVSQLFS